LDGQPAALSFEKQTNTLARRHRVRLWARAEKWKGQPLWLGSAVRCVDLAFDKPAGRFVYRVDPRSDVERDKVAQDLAFTGHAGGRAQLDRKEAPGRPPGDDGRRAPVLVVEATAPSSPARRRRATGRARTVAWRWSC